MPGGIIKRPESVNALLANIKGFTGKPVVVPTVLGRNPVAASGPMLQIAFLFDTTGSMYDYLERVRHNLAQLISEIKSRISNVYFGIIAYGDHCDADTTYVTKSCQLTANENIIKEFVASVEETGGGDEPEALEDALRGANKLNWKNSGNKCVVLIGDAPPHGVIDKLSNCPYEIDYKEEVRKLAKAGVKVYAVQCNRCESTAEVFRWIADQTNGKFLTLENIDDIIDLLVGICMKETGHLSDFIKDLRAKGLLLPGSTKERTLLALSDGRK